MATQQILRKALSIAQKASVARSISHLLNPSATISRKNLSKFNPLYTFPVQTPEFQASMVFTSVRGHLKHYTFEDPRFRNWTEYDPKQLITAKIANPPLPDMKTVIENLMHEAKLADMLILWLDCDLEGEAIAKEVEEICLRANAGLEVRRARFAALTKGELRKALENLTKLDEKQISAVRYRQEMDFRIGCTMTNFQTLSLGGVANPAKARVLSYGTCQTPLLKLVVDDFLEKKLFSPTRHWQVNVECKTQEQTPKKVWFSWDNDPIPNQKTAQQLCTKQFPANTKIQFQISSIDTVQTKKLRPLPLTTSTLLKLATSKLKISSDSVMQVAEKLYTKGLITYPRTETNRYHPSTNFMGILGKFMNHSEHGEWVKMLMENGVKPRAGKENDQAHSPIYPVKFVKEHERFIEQKLYELIIEYFLASLSQDTTLQTTTITILKDTLKFKHTHTSIVHHGYFKYYALQRPPSTSVTPIPSLPQNQPLLLSRFSLHQKVQPAPPRLTESQLITKMTENRIGTDSTIHIHIQTLLERDYVTKEKGEFEPTRLGLALVAAHKEVASELCEVDLRARMEETVRGIEDGKIDGEQKLKEDLKGFQGIYDKLVADKEKFVAEFAKIWQSKQKSNPQPKRQLQYPCKTCKSPMHFLSTPVTRKLICQPCSISYPIPRDGTVSTQNGQCHVCGWTVLRIQSSRGYANSHYNICPNCFNSPLPHMMSPSSSQDIVKLPCFRCEVTECQFHPQKKKADKGIYKCPKCNEGDIIVKETSIGTVMLACNRFPHCRQASFLLRIVRDITPTKQTCTRCQSKLCDLLIKTRPHEQPQLLSKVCLLPGCGVLQNYLSKKQS